MSSGLYSITTRASGTVLTAAIYNADHQNHVTNQNPSMTGAYSDNVAQMQIQTTPGDVGSESLSSSLAGELERLRYIIANIKGTTYWYSNPTKIGLGYVQQQTIAAQANCSFTSKLDATADVWEVIFFNVLSSSAGDTFQIQVGQGGAYVTSANYAWERGYESTATFTGNSAVAQTQIEVCGVISTANGASGKITIINPGGATGYKQILGEVNNIGSDGNWYRLFTGGRLTLNTNAIDSIRFKMATGNISGVFGLRKVV